MSILIKGMEMPKEGTYNIVHIYYDGDVTMPFRGKGILIAQGINAVPVPPHGRLIDADVLLEHMKKVHDKWKMEGHYTPTTDDEIMIMNMPTVIEAEEDE